MDDKILLDFKQITPESIALTFKGKYEKGGLDRLEQIRSDISVLLLTNNEEPNWYINSLNNAIDRFMDFYRGRITATPTKGLNDLYNGLYVNIHNQVNSDGFFQSIPVLLSWYNFKGTKDVVANDLIKSVEINLEQKYSDSQLKYDRSVTEVEKLRLELESTLDILNKEVGKIAVKEYAEIFEKQAFVYITGKVITPFRGKLTTPLAAMSYIECCCSQAKYK